MRRALLLAAALGVALSLFEVADAASHWQRARYHRSGSASRRIGRPFSYRSPRRTAWRSGRRPIARPAGVSLPELRTELTRLESGLGARVERLGKRVTKRPAPPVVLASAPPPVNVPAGLPVAPVVAGALGLSALAGLAGFALGQRHATRSRSEGTTREEENREASGHPPWEQVRDRIEATQRRLAAARARIRRLERGA